MFNKLIYTILTVIILCLLFIPVSSFAQEVKFEEGTVIGDSINMRLRPSTESPAICKLDQGTRIGIYCLYDDWIRVIYGNYRGYIKRDLVFLPSEDSYQANVFGDSLRLRKNPGTYSTVISTLEVGTPLTIKDIYGDWFYVAVNDTETGSEISGFVNKTHVKKSDQDHAGFTLLPGMSGTPVYNMQKELKKKNFYAFPCTGVYGDATKTAVRNFQRVAGLRKTGDADAKTLDLIYNDDSIKLEGSAAAKSGGVILKSDWYSTIQHKFTLGLSVKVIDVKTGKSYNVTRYGGLNHADVTPDTKKDTATMLETYGGEWSWDRRPVWVIINGVMYAASTNGMPHGIDFNRKDNMLGQVCIHFAGSKGHGNESIDDLHQEMIEYAYKKARG